MLSRWSLIAVWSLCTLASGCINRWNTRFPALHFESKEIQRREATHQDPYPDDTIGPAMGFRPPGYELPRTDPLRTKNHYRSTILKQQQGAPPNGSTGPGAQYPEAVHVD
jgi:hypothetical protein